MHGYVHELKYIAVYDLIIRYCKLLLSDIHTKVYMNNDSFPVYRESVRQFLTVMDPVGVEMRKKHRLRRRLYSNKGPHYLVHIDGYDKLKPYGFAIHGAIDG